MSNEFRLMERERITVEKCEQCYGAGKISIETVDGLFDCPNCHGIGYLSKEEEQ